MFGESSKNWYDNEYQFKTADSVYLGHKLTVSGVEPNEEKIRSIMDLPVPEDKKGVQWLLALVNYVGKFIPNLSEITAALRELLKKNVSWHWGNEQWIKEVLVSKRGLAYYDVNKPVRMQVVASWSRIGAVLIQDGKPIAYAWKSLTLTHQRYVIIDKLVVKSKLSPRSGSSLEAVEPHPWKGAIKCFFFNKKCWQLSLLVRGFINTSMGRKCRLKVIINHWSQSSRKQCGIHPLNCKGCC